MKDPTQMPKTNAYISLHSQNSISSGVLETTPFNYPFGLSQLKTTRTSNPRFYCQPNPKHNFLFPSLQLYCSQLTPRSVVSSPQGPKSAQLSPSPPPPPSSSHLAPPPPLAGSTHKAWGNTESSWAGIGGKGHRGGGEGQEAASFVADVQTSTPAPSSLLPPLSPSSQATPAQGGG